MYELKDKVLFITGAAQGLGKAYAERFLQNGAKVFFGDINEKIGAATEAEFKSQYGSENVTFVCLDVTKNDNFEDAFKKAISIYGHVDIVINNAGIMNESVWEMMIDINFTGVVRGTQLAYEHMRKDKGGRGGRIINISSVAGFAPASNVPVYSGSKHAVRAYTSSISLQPGVVENLGIELGCLCPDPAYTELLTSINDVKVHQYADLKQMLDQYGRIMKISTVADALMELIQLEEMNSAILMVTSESRRYMDLEMVDKGTSWPPAGHTFHSPERKINISHFLQFSKSF